MNHFLYKSIFWYINFISLPILCIAPQNPYNYDESYYNIAKKLGSSDGILVIAYNRPRFFAEAVNALSKTPEADYLPFIFVLDGGKKSTQKENIKIINNARIRNKFIIARDTNYGCGRSIIDARRFMFEWCNFNRIIIFEDDLVVSPEYITLTFNVHKWAKIHYPNIGVVSCFYRCYLDSYTKRIKLESVQETTDCFWGYCLDKTVYNTIKDILNEYENTFLTTSQGSNTPDIAFWMEKILYTAENAIIRNYLPCSIISYKKEFEEYITRLKTLPRLRNEQDRQFRLALYKKGYVKISTCVNRAKYIGSRSNRDNGINLDRFPSDMVRKNFKIECISMA